jgi:hypothetical protein
MLMNRVVERGATAIVIAQVLALIAEAMTMVWLE